MGKNTTQRSKERGDTEKGMMDGRHIKALLDSKGRSPPLSISTLYRTSMPRWSRKLRRFYFRFTTTVYSSRSHGNNAQDTTSDPHPQSHHFSNITFVFWHVANCIYSSRRGSTAMKRRKVQFQINVQKGDRGGEDNVITVNVRYGRVDEPKKLSTWMVSRRLNQGRYANGLCVFVIGGSVETFRIFCLFRRTVYNKKHFRLPVRKLDVS